MSVRNLIHLKATMCTTIDPVEVCKDLFSEGHQYMCVAHPKSKKKQAGDPHWHFQGVLVSTMNFEDLKKYLSKMAAGHSMRNINPTSRPVKRCKKECNELGFQYMVRHGADSVVYSNFTKGEIDELVQRSEAYVADLKDDGYNHLVKFLDFTGSPGEVHERARVLAYEFYMDHKETLWPPNFQKLVLYWVGKLAKEKAADLSAFVKYLSARA